MIQMKADLHNRVIVVTGGSSGIGAATAIACAEAGMDVVIGARRKDRLDEVARVAEEKGRRCLTQVCDVNKTDDINCLVKRTIEEFGRLDVMFANAGYGLYGPVMEISDQDMRDILETNFFGTLRCIRAAVEVMRTCAVDRNEICRGSRGHILICCSAAGRIGLPKYGAYSATKAAQDMIASSLRAELFQDGICVSSIYPIGTRTEFAFKSTALSSELKRPVIPSADDQYLQSPERVARAIIRCLQRPRPEVWPHIGSRLSIAACSLMPGLSAWAMRRMAQRSRSDILPTASQIQIRSIFRSRKHRTQKHLDDL